MWLLDDHLWQIYMYMYMYIIYNKYHSFFSVCLESDLLLNIRPTWNIISEAYDWKCVRVSDCLRHWKLFQDIFFYSNALYVGLHVFLIRVPWMVINLKSIFINELDPFGGTDGGLIYYIFMLLFFTCKSAL